MRFSEIIGNAGVARALSSMADSGRVAHAMLMYENEGCGALALALAYVQYLNCSNHQDGDSCGECPSCRQMAKLIHPDVHFVFPVNKGPKSPDDKPTSESYLKYWRELAVADPYFTEADLQKAIGIESKNGLIAVAEAKNIISKLSLTAVADGYKAVIFYLPEKMNQETANRLLKMVEEPPQKTIFLFITHAPEKVLQTIFSRCQSIRVMPLTKEEAEKVRAMKPADENE
jgi:DNA polymerase-3 subunit delta'